MGRTHWQLAVNRMGFFGSFSAGGIYEWESLQSVEISLGRYLIADQYDPQVNLAYRFSPWQVETITGHWQPIQIGAFMLYSLDNRKFFFNSPAKYPYKHYYDQTALRWGLEAGTVYEWKNYPLALAYHIRVLDAGVVAIYNNANKDLQYHVSSGFSVRYVFR